MGWAGVTYAAESFETGRSFDRGTSILLTGEPHGVRDRLFDTVAEGIEGGDAAILVAADAGAETVLGELRDRDALVADRLGVVDVTGEGGPASVGGVPVEHLGSPGDLTGTSLEFAKFLDGFSGSDPPTGVRVGLVSVSTLLMYADLQTAFRFLHVFTSRIRSAGLFGLFPLYPEMHEDQTTNTIRAIFDCEAAVDGEGVEVRGSGHLSA